MNWGLLGFCIGRRLAEQKNREPGARGDRSREKHPDQAGGIVLAGIAVIALLFWLAE